MRSRILLSPPALVLVLTVAGTAALAGTASQTDWSQGAADGPPLPAWTADFALADGVAWLSVPGRLSLAGTPLAPAIRHAVTDTVDGPTSICDADVDGDGDVDIVSVARYVDRILWFRNEGGSPGGWTACPVDSGVGVPMAVTAADLDGDGLTDVAAAGWSPGRVVWWRQEPGPSPTWTRGTVSEDFAGGHHLVVADVDGDGRRDLVGARFYGGVTWWRNEGGEPVVWTPQALADQCDRAVAVGAGDLDGDGDTDIVATHCVNKIVWWRNDGGWPLAWTAQILDPVSRSGHWVQVADLDGDGDQDVASIPAADYDLLWHENDGAPAPAWTERLIEGLAFNALTLDVADVDGDGDRDVIGHAKNDVYWFENRTGDAMIWTKHVLATDLLYAWPAIGCDLDGNGAIDVVVGDNNGDAIHWWEVTRFVAAGTLESRILDTGASTIGASLDWSAELPAGTALAFQVRSGDDPELLGAWSGDLTAPGPLPDPLRRYVQYRVRLETTDPALSPLLHDVTLTWSDLSAVGNGSGAPGGLALACSPNPAPGAAVLRFALPAAGEVTLEIYDLRGRRLRRIGPRVAAAGEHVLQLPGLASGIYLCRLRAGGREATSRLVVLH